MRSGADKFLSISMYFDIQRDIEEDIRQLEKVRDYVKGNGLIIVVDSNARSKMWHDSVTNQRGKILKEYLLFNDLYVMNEATDTPTFQSIRERSYIDLTITNNRLIRNLTEWKCVEEESCSDHNIVNFKIASVSNVQDTMTFTGVRYVTKQEDYKKFDTNLAENFIFTFTCTITTDFKNLDEE
jgi:hypothetical protein